VIPVTGEDEERDLFRRTWQVNPREESRNVAPTGFELPEIAPLSLLPTVCVEGRFDMNEPLLSRVKRHDIQLAVVSSLGALSDLDVTAHEEAPELVPLNHEVFKIITGHRGLQFV
jgi:hypothetical protein